MVPAGLFELACFSFWTPVRSNLPGIVACLFTYLRLHEPPSPLHQILEELADELFRCLIRQITLGIEAVSSIADHHLRLINGKHIQKDEYLSQMVLRPGRADGSDRSAHDRHRLPIPRAVSVRSRRPIDGVLQHTRNRVIVLRRHNQNGIRLADAPLELGDLRGWILFLVLIEAWNPIKLERLDSRFWRNKLRCRS